MMPDANQTRGKKASQLVRLLVVLIVAVIPLGALTIHLLQYEYKLPPEQTDLSGFPSGSPLAGLKADLIVPDKPPAPPAGLTCWFELRNEGTWKVRLLDCVSPGKVLLISVSYLGESGKGAAEKLTVLPGMESTLYGEGGFSESTDAMVDLLHGSSWRKRLDLSRFFDLSRPGVYEAAVSYQSQRFAAARQVDLKQLGADPGFVSSQPVRFTIPPPAPPKPEADRVPKAGPAN
jgi:hypothetical protein